MFAFGGRANREALRSVERYSVKGDNWMTFPELNIPRSNATGVIMIDHLYVIGGKNETGFVRQIERLNLKSFNNKFETIDIMLPHSGACDIGVVLMNSTHSYSEVMLIGGFNG